MLWRCPSPTRTCNEYTHSQALTLTLSLSTRDIPSKDWGKTGTSWSCSISLGACAMLSSSWSSQCILRGFLTRSRWLLVLLDRSNGRSCSGSLPLVHVLVLNSHSLTLSLSHSLTFSLARSFTLSLFHSLFSVFCFLGD